MIKSFYTGFTAPFKLGHTITYYFVKDLMIDYDNIAPYWVSFVFHYLLFAGECYLIAGLEVLANLFNKTILGRYDINE